MTLGSQRNTGLRHWTAILADDDLAARDLIGATLSRLGYNVVAVSSPREVLAAIKAHKAALALVAWSQAALDLLEARGELTPSRCYVICLLKRYDHDTVTAAFAAGADDAIAKPLIPAELTARLRHANHVVALEDFRKTFEEEGQLLAEISTRASFHSHRYLQSQLTNEFARAQRFTHALALIVAEVKLEHGDERTMRSIGQSLSAACRARVDWIARHSNDCFAVVLPETDLDGALRAAERVRARLSSDDALQTTLGPRATVNLGVSALPCDRIGAASTDGTQLLVDTAEAYLRVAARQGPGQIVGGLAL